MVPEVPGVLTEEVSSGMLVLYLIFIKYSTVYKAEPQQSILNFVTVLKNLAMGNKSNITTMLG